MKTVDLLRSLLPPVSYAPDGKYLSAELDAEAKLMDDVKSSANKALASITPFDATNTLSDWERIYAITPREGATQQERRQIVLTRMAATGGLSIPYFTELALKLGYSIEIIEPSAFEAGVGRCGERLYTEGLRWVWQVKVKGANTPKYYFRAGASSAGEPLMAFGESILEHLFEELKPAFTYCYFTYED